MAMDTLPELLMASARRFRDRPALAIRRGLRTEVWTYGQLAGGAQQAAARLASAGLRPGDRVLVLAPNTPELVVALFGVWLAGGVLVPIDARTPPEVVGRLRERADPRLLIATAPLDGLAEFPTVSPARVAGRMDSAEAGLPSLGSPTAGPAPADTPAGLAELVFTSGTTGAPKGVMLTHANILANVAAALDALPIAPGEHLLSLLPLSHMMEQTAGLLAPLASGATIFYATSRRSTALLATLQRHRIGLLVCVPEVLRLLLGGIEREVERAGQRRRWARLLEAADRLPMPARPALFAAVHRQFGGRLRLVLCGGAPLDAALWRTWERLGVRVIQGYGATECAPIVTSNRLGRRLPGTVGWPVQGVQVRLAGDGEVLVRGPNVTPGYWRDGDATAAAYLDGWYRTGDVGSFGRRGELRLLGRKKDMIVLADGRNVFPQDVEDELRREPAIVDCVVLGRPRPGGGEEVHAVVIPAEDSEAATAAVRRANGRLGPHQHIGALTIWPAADFPRTPSLKVKRGEVLAALEGPASVSVSASAPRPVADDLEARLFGVVARAAGRPVAEVRPEADLALDLGLDSLGRVELAVLLEEELGRSLPDEEMAAQHTVADLLAALERAGSVASADPLPSWPRRAPAAVVRALVQGLVLLPALRLLCRPRRVVGPGRLGALRGSVLLIANHTSHLDAPTVLSLLPPERRRRTAVAAAADYFFRSAPLATFSALALGAFPFHREGAVATSLAQCGDLVDEGYSIVIFPEGTRSRDGRLQPFKSGIGLLARELGVPVVPIHLAGLHAILPKGRSWPRPGPVMASVGEPLRLDAALSNAEAADILEAAMRQLAGSLG